MRAALLMVTGAPEPRSRRAGRALLRRGVHGAQAELCSDVESSLIMLMVTGAPEPRSRRAGRALLSLRAGARDLCVVEGTGGGGAASNGPALLARCMFRA